MIKKIIAYTVFFVSVSVLLFAKTTDADLLDREVIASNKISATTLDLGVQYPFNNTQLSSLFSVFGLVGGGFEVKGMKLIRVGKLGFDYQISTQMTAGDANLCQALDFIFIKQWQYVSQSSLPNFNYVSKIKASEKSDNFIFVVFLNQKDQSLMNKTCSFNIIIETILGSTTAGTQFFDVEVISNNVTTASWGVEED